MSLFLCLLLIAAGFLYGYIAGGKDERKKHRQTTSAYCPGCSRDMTTSANVLVEDKELVYYYCGFCNTVSRWDFDAPVPILIGSTRRESKDWWK